MKLNHQNLGPFSLEQKLKMVAYYSGFSTKSVLEGIDDVADAYDSKNLTHEDIHAVMGNMFQRQQMMLVLDHITSILSKVHLKSPVNASMASETFLVDNLLAKLQEMSDMDCALDMVYKSFPMEWKRLREVSLSLRQKQAISEEIQSALSLYLKYKAE